MATVAEITEIREKSGKVNKAKIVREKSENLRKKIESQKKSGSSDRLFERKVLPFYRFNLMISGSAEMAYQKVREISLRSGKSQGRCKSKKVATLFNKIY